MSFFKDFKADFTQAMNELMPDGNEMYDEDEVIGETAQEEAEELEQIAEPPKKTKKEKPVKERMVKEKTVKEKKTSRSKKQDDTEKATNVLRAEKTEVENKVVEESVRETDMDIAPEDMLEQIDDLLENELYSDEANPQLLLDDDIEVNTMDMSVEELLNQLAMKQNAEIANDMVEDVVSDEEEAPLSVDDLLCQLEDTTLQEETAQEDAEYIHEIDMGLEALLNQISANEAVYDELEENVTEPVLDLSEEKNEPEREMVDEVDLEAEEMTAEVEAVEQKTAELKKEELEESLETLEDLKERLEEGNVEPAEVEETPELTDELEENISAADVETNDVESEVQETEAIKEIIEEVVEEIVETEPERITQTQELEVAISKESEEVVLEETLEQSEEKKVQENNMQEEKLEDDIMSRDKDVISINSVEDIKEETVVNEAEEKIFNVAEADEETTYITKGTRITGDLETEGSIDIIGVVEGSIACKGKVVVGGNVVGDITAGELYANSARIEGNVKSYGSVKVGVGTMIIGGIEGESAVIAGAVNGDIDVKGPVIVDSTAVIMGNIKSRSVQINNGAVIEGFCSQSYSDIDVKSFFA